MIYTVIYRRPGTSGAFVSPILGLEIRVQVDGVNDTDARQSADRELYLEGLGAVGVNSSWAYTSIEEGT
jgi:hypothetical protein